MWQISIQNSELMNACKSLKDYTEYTHRIRNYARVMPLNSAVEKAITECIQEGILADFLSQNRAEAMKVSIYEYDAEKHLRMEKEDSYNDGYNDGKEEGKVEILMQQISKKLKKRKSIPQIVDELELDESEVMELMKQMN